jgi:hypothetical protein
MKGTLRSCLDHFKLYRIRVATQNLAKPRVATGWVATQSVTKSLWSHILIFPKKNRFETVVPPPHTPHSTRTRSVGFEGLERGQLPTK